MNGPVLDYSDCIVGSESQTAFTPWYGIGDEPFFKRTGFCPHCTTEATNVRELKEEDTDDEDSAAHRWYTTKVWSCSCGWWDMLIEESSGSSSADGWWESRTIKHAILKSFDLGVLEVPIHALRAYIRKHEDAIFRIHDKKMEELVASVFSDLFPGCEAKVCGKAYDGGVDLVLILHEGKYAVQVKRRQLLGKIESVSSIREFLGAILLYPNVEGGLYVTTSDDFSRQARQAAAQAIEKKFVTRYDLINRKDFLAMLDCVKRSETESWAQHLEYPFRSLADLARRGVTP